MFSKRHYEWLAKFAGEHMSNANREALADALARDNVKFNRRHFLAACASHGLVCDLGGRELV